ncbi:pimeloyl-ACP methyl ester carboxylesterase [Micromonospora pisi]|uniref:Pimeloyl-ACP methyl ester carboxylesterase n=1 Tax=Micromonospora pisi TaxID=589240 RepID=A0A495JDW7_9ACTN|nr:alpha/beta hydrolase [Micromonospora pisi]RKR86564.1 pimeloyl-ACP methyl ester carboxylesterase [Micromonospora pisi]
MRWSIAVPAALLSAGVVYEAGSRCRDRALPWRGRLVDVGGYRLRRYDVGVGAPAVVIIPGAGDCADSWLPVRQSLAPFTRVVSYDRPGLGGSEEGPPPTVDRDLTDLRRLLHDAAIRPPYVLVGHSLGGLTGCLYAQLHPAEVAGLVLVDSIPETVARDRGVLAVFVASGIMTSLFTILAPVGLTRLMLAWRKMPLYPEQTEFRTRVDATDYRRWIAAVCRGFARAAALRELRSGLRSAREAERFTFGVQEPRFGDLPLAVLTSRAYGSRWVAMNSELVTRARSSVHRLINDRSHNIHMRHPDLVVDAIQEIIARARLRATYAGRA